MESKTNTYNSPHSQLEDEDRLSSLTDDILLSILSRIDLTTAATTSVLSTRWRELPWFLPKLSVDVKDFLPVPPPEPMEANHMDEAMDSLTKATRSFLAKPRAISVLDLELYLNNADFSREIGPLLTEAIDGGMLKDLHLAVLDETEPEDCTDENMLKLAHHVHGFFTTYPSVLHCLTELSLYNLYFAKWDMNNLLFDCCKQLKQLSLSHCDAGYHSIWKIDAPNSKLSVLLLQTCRFERIDLVCLPKLEKLECITWFSLSVPLSFGFVPALVEVDLVCGAGRRQSVLKLSELLHGATGIHTLTLDFLGENIWMQPETKQLLAAFNKLKKLSLRGIFAEFDILWTTAFLEAVPSIEILQIQVWDHACDLDFNERRQTFLERKSPQWEIDFGSSKNLLLKELQFVGFRSLEQQFTFIRAVLERAPNLQTIVLRGDEQCDLCDALGPSSRESVFPKNEDGQEMVVRRITDGMFCPLIIFDE